MLRVDNQSYVWMGYPVDGPGAVQKDMTVRISWFIGLAWYGTIDEYLKFTPTQTKFTMTCGAVDLTATFLSPIEVRILSVTGICVKFCVF